MSNNLDSDQAQHYVGPDLGLNCLKMFNSRQLCRCKDVDFLIFLKGNAHKILNNC